MKFSGIVRKSSGRGKQLGFPTANIDLKQDIEDGIYVGWTNINNSPNPSHQERGNTKENSLPLGGEGKGGGERGEEGLSSSLIFIGAAETFGESERRAEIYILDFAGVLYGRTLEVEILKKIRDNQKFESKEDLIHQMKKDEEAARRFFAGAPHEK